MSLVSRDIVYEPYAKIKRYYTTRSEHNLYPPEFVSSRRKKYVHVLSANLVVVDDDGNEHLDAIVYELPKKMELHASFVQTDDYLDHYVCICNEKLPKRKKFEQANSVKSFDLWITDFRGQKINLTPNHHLLVELMLEY